MGNEFSVDITVFIDISEFLIQTERKRGTERGRTELSHEGSFLEERD